MSTKNLGSIVAPLGETRCQNVLSEGVKIVKLALLGSVQQIIAGFFEWLFF